MLGGAALSDNSNSAPAVIKILCPKDPEFYAPLALSCQKGQHLPAPEVYKNQSPKLISGDFSSLILGTSRRANIRKSSLISEDSGFPR